MTIPRWFIPMLFCVSFAQSLDDAAAAKAISQFLSNCEAQGKALWDASLCGPLVIVNTGTRSSIASQRDPDEKFVKRGDVFVGVLPSQYDIANTAFNWGGHKWTMVRGPLPVDPFKQLALISHEAFHRVQDSWGLGSNDQPSAHLDTESGRLWLRLELRALARAMRAETDADLRQSATDALLFRTQRHALHPGSEVRESAMERQEGLAEYTGYAVALKETGESVSRVARIVESFEDSPAYARSFAYVTGPGLGLVLDRVGPGWRKHVREASMEGLLRTAMKFLAPENLSAAAESAASRYGFRAVAASEDARERRHQELIDSLTAQFVDGPILQFPRKENLNRAFNPSELVSFGSHGTFYPTGTFRGPWGVLHVESTGAILSSDNMSVRVVAPANPVGKPLTGPGWSLELASGWTIRAMSGRAGSFEVVRVQ